MDLHIGRTGLILVFVVFLLLAVEDVFIWLNRGVVPGIEFFVASLILVGLLVLAINQVRRERFPRP